MVENSDDFMGHGEELKRIDSMITLEAAQEEIQSLKLNLTRLEEKISTSGVFTTGNNREDFDKDLKIQLIKRMKMLSSTVCRILGTPDEETYGTFFD